MNSGYYLHFEHDEWARLAANTELPLTIHDLRTLAALGDPIDIAEADAIYRPLVALVHMYSDSIGQLLQRTNNFLEIHQRRTPFIVGVAGSVAVGKSTTSRLLRELLRRYPNTPRVSLVTTDGFLYPNAELERRGIMDRKGFPESYDITRLLDFLRAVKSGERRVKAPVYDHVTYDIVPDEHIEVDLPQILVVEGLNVLQPVSHLSTQNNAVAASDLIDISIYVDAATQDIERWYVSRMFKLREIAFSDPRSHFFFLHDTTDEELTEFALSVWNTTNLPNLIENILPTRERANIILHKNADHIIDGVDIRKL
ncbi:MAG: type I pantothenate kinase [Actinomycetaceae bacterium]|nr:type I pantothenate kinase [Actinomycetaceae bacterium]MDY6082869.1 type I pantothenate kinase [Actinomycetaceae bacterium]